MRKGEYGKTGEGRREEMEWERGAVMRRRRVEKERRR